MVVRELYDQPFKGKSPKKQSDSNMQHVHFPTLASGELT